MFYLDVPGGRLARQSVTDVQQSLYILARTRKGEIPYLPDYGLESVYKHEPAASEIEREMSAAIARFEPRVDLKSVSVAAVPNTNGRQFSLKIDYFFETLPQVFDTSIDLG